MSNSSITINGTAVSLGGTRTVNLADLGTVSISSPTNGQVLKYNGTNWINDTDGGGGGGITLTSLSVTDSGGDGSLSYNNTTGVFTYTGPSATEVRAHFSQGTGITITDGVVATTITQYTDALARQSISIANGSAAYNNSTGVITIPTNTSHLSEVTNLFYTDTRARAAFSQGTGITITSGVIATTITQYTDALARQSISIANGSAAYNNSTGVITIPTNTSHLSEVTNLFYTDTRARAAFSQGTGITITSGVIATTITQYTDALARSANNRTVAVSDGTTITPDADTSDNVTQANTQGAGTLTIAAPSGTPVDGQKLVIRLKSTNVQTFSWNAIYRGSTDLALPTASSGASKTDYIGFIYNSADSKWDLLAKTFGF